MKKKVILISYFFLVNNICFPQNTFQKYYYSSWGTGFSCVAETFDGGFIFGGAADVQGSFDCSLIIRTDSNGDTLWSRRYNVYDFPADYKIIISDIIVTSDSNFVFTGFYHNGSNSNEEIILTKLNGNGDTLWQKGCTVSTDVLAYGVRQTSDGGFIIVGINSDNQGFTYLFKADASGNFVWGKRYLTNDTNTGIDLEIAPDGGFIISGIINYVNPYQTKAFALKTDPSGNPQWAKIFEYYLKNLFVGVENVPGGGYVFCGSAADDSIGDQYAFMIKLDVSGNVVWDKLYESTNTLVNPVTALNFTKAHDDGYVIGARYPNAGPNGFLLFKTDASGNVAWAKRELNQAEGRLGEIIATSDSGLIMAGAATISGVGGGAIAVKTDSFANTCDFNNVTINSFSSPLTVTTPVFTTVSIGSTFNRVIFKIQSILTVDTLCTATGIEKETENKLNDVSVFPNPNNGEFNVKFNSAETQEIRISLLDLTGRVVHSEIYESISGINAFDIEVNNVPPGMFLLELNYGDYHIVKKVMVN